MPLYEYECDANGHRFEIIQKSFSDPPPERCPTCGSPVHKLMSSPAIQFKGTGWYITDYAQKGKSDSSAGASAKSDTKSDGTKTDGTASKSDAPKSDTSSASTTAKESKG